MLKIQSILLLSLILTLISCGKAEGEGTQSDGLADSDHRVFATSSSYSGNMGGLSGADSKCKSAAEAAGLTRTYKAILSDSGNDAEDRLIISGEVYIIDSLDNSNLVVNSGVALWNTDSVNLLSSIDLDENGNTVNDSVWTGTGSDGGVLIDNCTNWTSSVGGTDGFIGSSASLNDQWVESISEGCNNSNRLYCISQQ